MLKRNRMLKVAILMIALVFIVFPLTMALAFPKDEPPPPSSGSTSQTIVQRAEQLPVTGATAEFTEKEIRPLLLALSMNSTVHTQVLESYKKAEAEAAAKVKAEAEAKAKAEAEAAAKKAAEEAAAKAAAEAASKAETPETEDELPDVVEPELPPTNTAPPKNLNSLQRDGMIRTSDLVAVAKDYDKVPVEFLSVIRERDSITVDRFKSYAKEFMLPGQYIQRFIDDAFVYKMGNDFTYVPVRNSLNKHSYNWDNLVHYNYEKDYVVNGSSRVSKGIDISSHQGNINWNSVANDGVEFAFIRVGFRYGAKATISVDEKFHQNIRDAQNAGIKVGVYFFSQAVNTAEAREEANFVLDEIDGYTLDLPVVFDIEGGGPGYRANNNSVQTNTNICSAFLDTVKNAGYKVMLYSYAKFSTENLDLSQLQHYDLWLAQYYRVPFFPYNFKIWQYSSTGRVDGIKGNVDMNMMFHDYVR